MAIAIDVARVHRFITERDRKLPPEQQTVWLIGPVSARDQAELEDILFEATLQPDGITLKSTRIRQRAFKHGALVKGLRGWENFRDASGAPVVFANAETQSSLIGHDDRMEIADAIIALSKIVEDDQKN